MKAYLLMWFKENLTIHKYRNLNLFIMNPILQKIIKWSFKTITFMDQIGRRMFNKEKNNKIKDKIQ